MRLVGPSFAVEVCFRVASAARRWRFSRTIFCPYALHRGPGFDQRAIDRKVIRGKQRLDLGLRQDRAQEFGRDVSLKQPVAVLREHRMVPGRIVNADADEPSEQKIVFQPLHQKPFRTDRIESLQQHGPQKLLGRDRRPSDRRVKCPKLSAKCRECLVHDQPDSSKWMIGPDPFFQIDIAEKFARSDIAATHASTPNLAGTNES